MSFVFGTASSPSRLGISTASCSVQTSSNAGRVGQPDRCRRQGGCVPLGVWQAKTVTGVLEAHRTVVARREVLLRCDRLAQRFAQARFSEPRLATERDDLTLATTHQTPPFKQRRKLDFTADQRAQLASYLPRFETVFDGTLGPLPN